MYIVRLGSFGFNPIAPDNNLPENIFLIFRFNPFWTQIEAIIYNIHACCVLTVLYWKQLRIRFLTMKKMPKMDKEAESEALVHSFLTLLAPYFSVLLCFDLNSTIFFLKHAPKTCPTYSLIYNSENTLKCFFFFSPDSYPRTLLKISPEKFQAYIHCSI